MAPFGHESDRMAAMHGIRIGLLIAISLGFVTHLHAQAGRTEKVSAHMPAETVAVVSIWPEQLAGKQAMQMAPLEVLTAAGLEQIGIDPLKIERMDVMFGFPGPRGPQFGALIQTQEAVNVAELNPQIFKEPDSQQDGEFEFYRLAIDSQELYLHFDDPKTFLVGTPIFAKQMTQADGQGRLALLTEQIRSSQDLMALVDVGTLSPLLSGILQGQGQQLPREVSSQLGSLIENSEFFALRVIMDDPEKLQFVLVAPDEQTASNMFGGIGELLDFLQKSALAAMKIGVPANTPTGQATHAYFERISQQVRQGLTPKLSRDRIVLELEDFRNVGTIGVMTGLLLPAVQSARLAARRMQSSNNQKQIMLAFHNFHSAYRTLPAAAGLDDQGEPILSWRVAILPFIEEAELYQKFRLDEPWDSEHNLALLEEMPEVFKHPDTPTEPGYTVYQVAVGDGTVMKLKEPTSFAEITDGTSNTIMLVEVPQADAVPWTAPRDYEVDLESPGEGLSFRNGATQVGFADGSVRTLSENLGAQMLKALFTRAGGEVVDF